MNNIIWRTHLNNQNVLKSQWTLLLSFLYPLCACKAAINQINNLFPVLHSRLWQTVRVQVFQTHALNTWQISVLIFYFLYSRKLGRSMFTAHDPEKRSYLHPEHRFDHNSELRTVSASPTSPAHLGTRVRPQPRISGEFPPKTQIQFNHVFMNILHMCWHFMVSTFVC